MSQANAEFPNLDSYLVLVKRFPLLSIRDDQQLAGAQREIDALFAAGSLDEGQEQYLEALSDLVELYESQHVKVDASNDAEMLAYLMNLKDATQADVALATGISKSTISEVLAGKRRLTRQHIAKLAQHFGVGPSAFAIAE